MAAPKTHFRHCPACKTEWTEEEVALQVCDNCEYPDEDLMIGDEENFDDLYYPDGD